MKKLQQLLQRVEEVPVTRKAEAAALQGGDMPQTELGPGCDGSTNFLGKDHSRSHGNHVSKTVVRSS